jgi:mannose-1-phosphate guanylyltransferase
MDQNSPRVGNKSWATAQTMQRSQRQKGQAQAQRPVRGAIILAGGEGSRLRDLTRQIVGHPAPKQFCPVVGDTSLLEQTRRRVSIVVPEEYTLTVVNQAHERFYQSFLADVPDSRLVVQPGARGTAAAIVYALLRADRIAPTASMAIFPCDHYVDDDTAFMRHVELAFDAVEESPELTVLLGITPDSPETGYGWIEPARSSSLGSSPVLEVRRFWEKPPEPMAQKLMELGCLWNSFVVGRVSTVLGLVIMARPQLYSSFAAIRTSLATGLESSKVRTLYAGLAAVDFSSEVLTSVSVNLEVIPVHGVHWSDLGEPRRLMDTLVRQGSARGGPSPIHR